MAVAIFLVYFFEFAQQFLLLIGESNRCFHNDMAHQITCRGLAHRADAFAAQPEHLTTLRFGGNFDFRFAIERRDMDIAPKGGNGKADRHFTMQIRAFTLEYRVRL